MSPLSATLLALVGLTPALVNAVANGAACTAQAMCSSGATCSRSAYGASLCKSLFKHIALSVTMLITTMQAYPPLHPVVPLAAPFRQLVRLVPDKVAFQALVRIQYRSYASYLVCPRLIFRSVQANMQQLSLEVSATMMANALQEQHAGLASHVRVTKAMSSHDAEFTIIIRPCRQHCRQRGGLHCRCSMCGFNCWMSPES